LRSTIVLLFYFSIACPARINQIRLFSLSGGKQPVTTILCASQSVSVINIPARITREAKIKTGAGLVSL